MGPPLRREAGAVGVSAGQRWVRSDGGKAAEALRRAASFRCCTTARLRSHFPFCRRSDLPDTPTPPTRAVAPSARRCCSPLSADRLVTARSDGSSAASSARLSSAAAFSSLLVVVVLVVVVLLLSSIPFHPSFRSARLRLLPEDAVVSSLKSLRQRQRQ